MIIELREFKLILKQMNLLDLERNSNSSKFITTLVS